MTDVERPEESDTENSQDFCRVCRCGATTTRALFYPCLCTGSIKYVHQDCLMQWLKHSKREFCELCKHKFAFAPIYSADMPPRLPIAILIQGLLSSVRRAVYSWFHYSLVAIAWLLVVPLTACRICRSLFTGSVSSLLTLPLDMLSTDNIFVDCLYGIVVVGLTLGTFVCFMWVREQIMVNGGPEWLDIRPLRVQRMPQDAQNAADNEPIEPGNILNDARNLLPHMLNALADNFDENLVIADQDIQNDIEELANNHQINENADDNIAADGNNQLVGPIENGAEAAVEADVNNEPFRAGDEGAAANGAAGGGGGNEAAVNHEVDDFNLEWARAVEELTWEKLIGLDGSLFFLEHVFWIVSLNTLFILVFAFCPYHIGHFTVLGFKLNKLVSWTKVDGVITTIIGYIIIAFGLLMLHKFLKYTKFKCFEKPCHLTGLGFIIIKVALLTILEIGLVPLLCGVWIDICALNMFNSTLNQRHNLFQHAPVTFLFMHWTVGVMYLFYFASFLLLLKEMLRPGVFWFLKNFNDPNFNPIQDMINQSVVRLIKRFCINCSIFAIIIFMMVWIPNKIIRMLFPGFLPYKFQNSKDSPMDYSLEILFLQVVLPMLFDGHTMFWLKTIIRFWCLTVSNLLDLRSFLLGDVPFEPGDIIMNYCGSLKLVNQSNNMAMGDHATNNPAVGTGVTTSTSHLAAQGPNGNYRPYRLPRITTAFSEKAGDKNSVNKATALFRARFFILICLVLSSIVVFSTLILTIPVSIGRFILSKAGFEIYCDLISLLCGLFTVALVTKITYTGYQKLMDGDGALGGRFRNRFITGMLILWKLVLLAGVVFVWLPLVLGLLINLCVLSPIRVPLHKSVVLSFWENWMFGMMHLKVWIILLLFGPRWFRERIDLIEQELARRENLRIAHLARQAGPMIAGATLAVSGPLVFAKSIAPLFYLDDHYVLRRIYPAMFLCAILVLIIWFQFRQLHRLYEHIKNERYLVGQQLVNYER